MSGVKSTMPLWKWILLIVFGSALFLFLSQTVPVVGSVSSNTWIKVLLLLLGATAVLAEAGALYIKRPLRMPGIAIVR